MILGVDHLALNIAKTDQAKDDLTARGFACAFMERDVPNDPAKKNLLDHYQSTHDLGVFRNKNSIAIEITNHGALAKNNTPYQYHNNYIELYTSYLVDEKNFWKEVFKFKEQAIDTLKFESFVPNWSCILKLTEKNDLKNYTLDGNGYSCLAFLTNNIDKDTQTAENAGAKDLTASFQSVVNKRSLNIVMFRTPGGAICELIQIGK